VTHLPARFPRALGLLVFGLGAALGAVPGADPIERLDPRLDAWIPAEVRLEVLAEGFRWAEGPVWLPSEEALLFSDVPNNRVHRWSEADGLSVYLEPSGHTGYTGNPKEEGANGLALDPDGHLLLCQHGDRRLARMRAPLDAPAPVFETLASHWQGRPFNSPNDLTVNAAGQIFFTDPIYGLPRGAESEMGFRGVFRVDPDGTVTLLERDESMPNGIALSADGRELYVANSYGPEPFYSVLYLDEDGSVRAKRRFFFARDLARAGLPGLPDGLKVHPSGLLFATGPGGVLVLDPHSLERPHLGTILTGRAAANCAFNADYSALYITATDRLLRLRLIPPE
jgi:gluconolactonase